MTKLKKTRLVLAFLFFEIKSGIEEKRKAFFLMREKEKNIKNAILKRIANSRGFASGDY